MEITLLSVRETLRKDFGQGSFIASFVNAIQADKDCPTACINAQGILRYNPAFVNRHIAGPADLFCLVMHEIMHPMFGHFIYNNGPLENLAADMVINASISLLFPEASARGSLFKKIYSQTGMEGLLRPLSLMHDSRYSSLYDAFYISVHSNEKLTTGEVIQTLKVLTPAREAANLLLLGTHTGAKDNRNGTGRAGMSAEDLGKIAEDLKRAAKQPHDRDAGFGDILYGMFVEAIKSHLSIRKALLEKFTTKRKMDRFKQSIHRTALTTSPIPIHPSKRDFVLLAAGIPPFHYHNRAQRVATQERGLAVYLDVSGSVNEFLPKIVSLLQRLKSELTTIFLFSNQTAEIAFKDLLAGHVKTTYGTDFNCIADSILERRFDKAVILTDGFACLDEAKQEELKKRKLQILTILFGGKWNCDDFAPFGDVVQLDEICE